MATYEFTLRNAETKQTIIEAGLHAPTDEDAAAYVIGRFAPDLATLPIVQISDDHVTFSDPEHAYHHEKPVGETFNGVGSDPFNGSGDIFKR